MTVCSEAEPENNTTKSAPEGALSSWSPMGTCDDARSVISIQSIIAIFANWIRSYSSSGDCSNA